MKDMLKHQFEGFIRTPQIWVEPNGFPYPLFHLAHREIQKSPEGLHLPPGMVLGKRVEQFFHYYVTHFSAEKVLAHNEQIIEAKKTLGELDFILKSPTGSLTHVELIYKFYLFDPGCGSKDLDQWTGPNHRDNLLKKLNRLKTQQFPLLFKPATQLLLDRLEITAEAIHQKMCFKANLFVPLHSNRNFPEINQNAITGYWIRAEEFTADAFGENCFYSPKKPNWPVAPHYSEKWYSYEEILPQITHLHSKQQSPLVWMKKTDGSYHRFFVVWW